MKFLAFIAEVEIELAVRSEYESVHAVVVVAPLDSGEQKLALVGLAVAVGIGQHEHIRRTGNDDLVAEHADAQCGVDARVLVEHSLLVRGTVAIGVFENHHAIASRLENPPLLKRRAIIHAFGEPDPPAFVDVHVGGVANHRFGGEEGSFEALGHSEAPDRFAGGCGAHAGGVGGNQIERGKGQRTQEQ